MKLVDVKNFKFLAEPRYHFFGWAKSGKVLGQVSAVKALVKARKFLPKGYNFKIWDAQRPRAVQIAMINSFRRRFKITHPKLTVKKREELVFKFAAKPLKKVIKTDTHRRGGAFDLTIVDKNGNELYMGTDHDELTKKAAADYFEKKKKLTAAEKEAKKNRRLLKKAMLSAGFENYAPEWWHWSWKK
jgi:D-alanyl-D-alanine dipeptidase